MSQSINGYGGATRIVVCVWKTGGAVGHACTYLAPNAPKLAPLLFGLRLVHVRDPLSEVPCRVLGALDVLQLQQRRVGVLVRLGALVAEKEATHIKSRRAIRTHTHTHTHTFTYTHRFTRVSISSPHTHSHFSPLPPPL